MKDGRTDGRTDRQTDRRTEFSSLYRVCIACSAVKMNRMIMANGPTDCSFRQTSESTDDSQCVEIRFWSGRGPTSYLQCPMACISSILHGPWPPQRTVHPSGPSAVGPDDLVHQRCERTVVVYRIVTSVCLGFMCAGPSWLFSHCTCMLIFLFHLFIHLFIFFL